MSKTEQNLKDAFAGESQANRKYLAFAKKADAEGFKQAAKLFRAAAEAETVHAHNHLKELGVSRAQKRTLKRQLTGILRIPEDVSQMIKDAESEGNKGALRSFNYAMM